MDEIDAMLDALWSAALEGDSEAAEFLCMFAPWAVCVCSAVYPAPHPGERDVTPDSI